MSRANVRAFPIPGYRGDETVDCRQEGMSILEHYAGLAMAARVTANPAMLSSDMARLAVQDARALVAELEGGPVKQKR